MVSHDLQKGFAMCTHALVLAKGKVVAFDEKDAFVRAHATGRAYLERGLSRRSATERYVRALEEAMS